MQMGPKEIAVEYRTAANKDKQITVLAELNQVAERKIAEILSEEGEELPKKWQEQLQKPTRRSRKFPEGVGADASASPGPEPGPEPEAETPETPSVTASREIGRASSLTEGAKPATDRDIFEAVAALLPEPAGAASASPDPQAVISRECAESADAAESARDWTPAAAQDPDPRPFKAPRLISAEELLREACRMLTSALDLEPETYHVYSCGVLDLVRALTEEV